MKLTEQQLRNIISEAIVEGLGQRFSNFVSKGTFRTNSGSENKVVELGFQNGWRLSKIDGNENSLEGVYQAKIMSGVGGNLRGGKKEWPMLIAVLNRELYKDGLSARGSNFQQGFEDLMGRPSDGGAPTMSGTITIARR